MDVYERRVFRRKRPLIADTMGFSIPDQKRYMEEGLLDDTMMGEIMSEATEFGQMFKFLDMITTRSNALHVFYDILTERELSWMAEEIKAEISAERGEMEVEEYVYREAGMLVHRQFGDTTRVSEADKKEMQLLLAIRYQTGKEAWQSHVMHTNLDLDKALDWKSDESNRMKLLVDKVTTFLRVQQKHVNELTHDMYSPPDLLKEIHDQEVTAEEVEPGIDYLTSIERTVDHLLEVLARIIFERENLTDERKRCLEILQINRPAMQLDTMLNFALMNASQDTTQAKREANLSDKLAHSLDSRMKNLRLQSDRDLAAKERYISQISTLLKDKTIQIGALEKQSDDFRQKWEDEIEETVKWKKRCEILEKTRRLGYYTPGWYDKLYEIEGIQYSRLSDETPPPLVPHTDKQQTGSKQTTGNKQGNNVNNSNSAADNSRFTKKLERPSSHTSGFPLRKSSSSTSFLSSNKNLKYSSMTPRCPTPSTTPRSQSPTYRNAASYRTNKNHNRIKQPQPTSIKIVNKHRVCSKEWVNGGTPSSSLNSSRSGSVSKLFQSSYHC